MDNTKICEACDQEIGASEKICPKCNADFDELNEQVTAVQRAQAVLDKRRKKTEAETAPPVETPVKKRSVFSSLGRK